MFRKNQKGETIEYRLVLFRINSDRPDFPGTPDECTLVLNDDTVELSKDANNNKFLLCMFQRGSYRRVVKTMGRNHIPDCHTEEWTGASGQKVYDPFCPFCQEERRREEFWIVTLSSVALTLGVIGLITGITGLICSIL